MKHWPRVDFGKIVQEVRQSRCKKADLSIWSGCCSESDLIEFIQKWPLAQMPYRIWEYVSEIAFERDTLPRNVTLLERGRLFGEGGDLELRRDGTEFIWCFIGSADVQLPVGWSAKDFWNTNPNAIFYRRKETALLWGKRNGNHWHDNRVAAARLEYPVSAHWPRVQIEYWVFSRGGRVEFVWYTKLSEWKEVDYG